MVFLSLISDVSVAMTHPCMIHHALNENRSHSPIRHWHEKLSSDKQLSPHKRTKKISVPHKSETMRFVFAFSLLPAILMAMVGATLVLDCANEKEMTVTAAADIIKSLTGGDVANCQVSPLSIWTFAEVTEPSCLSSFCARPTPDASGLPGSTTIPSAKS